MFEMSWTFWLIVEVVLPLDILMHSLYGFGLEWYVFTFSISILFVFTVSLKIVAETIEENNDIHPWI